MPEISSRRDARSRGLKRYFTGKPCVQGHSCERWTLSAKCLQCALDLSRNWRVRNPEQTAVIAKRTREKHIEKCRAASRRWNANNPEKYRAARLKYETANKRKRRAATKEYLKRPDAKARINENHRKKYAANREKERARNAARYRANPAKTTERNAFRRARQASATPPWVDRKKLAAIYAEAKRLRMTVDHIAPIRHPLICGLHVPWNLQFLTREENTKKGNRFSA